MRVRITWPEGHEQILDLEHDELLVGRSEECDVVVGDAHVSKRHLRLLRGLVAVDLTSANGTYLDGHRIEGAVLAEKGELTLGVQGVRLEVLEPEPERNAEASQDQADLEAAWAELDELRAIHVEQDARERSLRDELARTRAALEHARIELRNGPPASPASTATAPPARTDELNPELREILATLRGDHLRVLEAVAGLRRRIEERPAAPAAPLNTASEGSTPLTGLFFRLQGENQELRRRLERLTPSTEGSSEGSSEGSAKDALTAS